MPRVLFSFTKKMGMLFVKKLSIVVPIYNKAEPLKYSLKSLLATPSKDTEFLLIDDASSDDSFFIAEEFAKQDERVRLLRNECTAGVSYTRNKGIRESSGEYIGFFDADDLVDVGFYQALYETATRKRKYPDLVVGNFKTIQSSTNILESSNMSCGFKNLIISWIPFSFQRSYFLEHESVSCCNKIYHKEFLSNKYFPNYIKEDGYFHTWVIHDAKRVIENRNVTYYYCIDQSTRNLSYFNYPTGNFFELIEAYEWVTQKIADTPKLVSSLNKIQCNFFRDFIESCFNWNLPFSEKVELIGTVLDYCTRVYGTEQELNLSGILWRIYCLQRYENQKLSTEQLQQKLLLLSKMYPKKDTTIST